MITYDSMQELISTAEQKQCSISEVVIEEQAHKIQISRQALLLQMEQRLDVMTEAVQKGQKDKRASDSGLSGGDAFRIREYRERNQTVGGPVICKVMEKAVATAEQNAAMGKVCAAPTAGAAGIIPAVLLTIMEEQQIAKDQIVQAMFTASAIGMVIAEKASLSGAEGGCQAECGSAAAMAAGAAVELMGGTPRMVGNACAISLKNVLGLVCDPVAGLVEVPCVKRNAIGAVNAIASAEMALAGIESRIPIDEVIEAMKQVGDLLPSCLKETAKGGIATTKKGLWYGQILKEMK